MLLLCAVVKKKLVTFEWTGNEFREREEFALPDIPRSVHWSGGSIIVGFRKEYILIEVWAAPSSTHSPCSFPHHVTPFPHSRLIYPLLWYRRPPATHERSSRRLPPRSRVLLACPATSSCW